MRADRLISLLLLLQRRTRLTAAEAAAELEVSERTARRDLEALAMSGVPVYSTHGRGGGWQLIGGASTDLTGLSMEEARALFLTAGPTIEQEPALKSAMRKLTEALPETFRTEAEAAAGAIKVDTEGWSQVGPARAPVALEPLTIAVVEGRKARIDYEGPRSPKRTRTVHPLGLVTKRNIWYLVANTSKGLRTFRLSRVGNVRVLDEPVNRPQDFDLDVAWENIVSSVKDDRPLFEQRVLADPDALPALRWVFTRGLEHHGTHPDGRLELTLREYTHIGFAGQIAGFGASVELVDPPKPLIDEMRRITAELHAAYGG